MTVMTDLKAISLTTNGAAAGKAAGTNFAMLITNAETKVNELQILIKQIVALHPSGDSNIAVLNSILAELA